MTDRGQVLLYVLILLLLSAALGGALSAMWNVEIVKRSAQRDGVLAYYLAQAGIEKAKNQLGASDFNWAGYGAFGDDTFSLGEGNVTVSISRPWPRIVDINATGRVRNATRTIYLRVDNLTASKMGKTWSYGWWER
ncbi:MAG: hypothetical protein ACM3OC_07085 [Deltaproteobacteria bacterium]